MVVSSESQMQADKAKKKWKLHSLELLGDPSLSIARHLKEEGLLDVFISIPHVNHDPWAAAHPYMSYYTNGCAQPATVVVSKQKEVWFSHTVVPHKSNGGGAVSRPFLRDVWQEIKRTKLQGLPARLESKRIRKQTLTDVGKTANGVPIKWLNRIFLAIILFVTFYGVKARKPRL